MVSIMGGLGLSNDLLRETNLICASGRRRPRNDPPLAFLRFSPSLRALMEKSNKAVLTDLQAFDIDSLKERLAALRRFL